MKLIPFKDGRHSSQPDPFLIQAHDGKFYLYSTDKCGVHCFRADELLGDYEDLGLVLKIEGKKDFWAPSVIYTGGKYYIYVSCIDENSDDAHGQAMHVAVADKPEGPFLNAKFLIEPFSIDSHVVENEDGLFIFYSVNDYEAERAGTYVVVDKMKDPWTVCGNPAPVVRATLDQEIFEYDRFKKGQHWHTLEGAFYFKEGDYHYVIYSGNCYQREYYYLGYASAKSDETDLTKIKFQKQPDDNTYAPLIYKNEFEEGTGHNSVIKVDGQYYAVYHGRDAVPDTRIKGDRRTARICRLEVKDGKITAFQKENEL